MTDPAQDMTARGGLRAIITPIICIAIVGVGLGLSIPLLSLEMEAMGISGTMIGLNTAMPALAAFVLAPMTPALLRMTGVKALIVTAVLVSASTLLAFHVTPFWAWFPLRLVFGAALGAVFVVGEFWINASIEDRRRGLAMGIYATILSLGFAAGPVILSLTGRGTIAPYAIGAAILLVAMIPVLASRQPGPRIDHKASASFIVFIFAAPAATLAAFTFGAVETGAYSLLAVYGLRNGLEEASATVVVSFVALGNVLLQVPIGLAADILDRRLTLAVCGVLGALGAAALPFLFGSTVLLCTVVALWGGVIVGLYTVGLAHLGERFSGADLAMANSVFVMLYSAGALAGPAALGTGLDVWNPHGFAVVLTGLFAIYALITLVRWLQHPALWHFAHRAA